MNNLLFFPSSDHRAIRLPRQASPASCYLAVRINDSSLLGAHICRGDFAIIELTQEVASGELVAVRLSTKKLVRYLYFEPDHRVRLEAAHPSYPPSSFLPSQVALIGRVIRVERDLIPRPAGGLGVN
jgi:SOS-response transcriptional repressor LexA